MAPFTVSLRADPKQSFTYWPWIYFVNFLIVVPLILYTDNIAVTNHHQNLRLAVTAFAIVNFLFMFWKASYRLRLLMLVLVPLSYLGEVLLSEVFGWYRYATESIPWFVPFGHAIIYASGYYIAYTDWFRAQEPAFRKLFPAVFVCMFVSVAFFLNDWFSPILGVIFFFLIYRKKRYYSMYYCIGICAIYAEFIGAHYKCWIYKTTIFGVIPSASPPVGIALIYATGDLLLAKITRYLVKEKNEAQLIE
jgi:hypothetical protein